MEEKINEILETIGLNKNERIIYLDLARHNSSTALDISKRTKIHRTNTYDALRKLIGRGFVSEIVNEKGRIFVASPPERISGYIEQIKDDFESLAPYLSSITKDEEKESVSLYQGVFALREALKDLLSAGKPIKVYGIPQEAIQKLGLGFLADFHKQRIKKKIPMLHIYNQNVDERISQLNRMQHTYARHLAKEYNALSSTLICGNTVLLILFAEPTILIKIKNSAIAETYNKYFDLLWKQAKV